MTFSDRIPPPPKTESWQELYRWNYRIFELLNGNKAFPGFNIEPSEVQLMYADQGNKDTSLDARLRKVEEAVALMERENLTEIRKELNELRKLLAMEV